MKNLVNKIQELENQILTEDKKKIYVKQQKYFLNEMRKVGIEKLPYSYSSLKRFIDPETMDTHYNKHYKGYVDKLNAALNQSKFGDMELEQIVKSIKKYNKTIQNNAGGAFNHAMFWKMLSPKTINPEKFEIYKKIESEFGNFRTFVKKFESEAKDRFGSGWVWLVLTNKGKLKIMTTANQENPLMNTIEGGGYPLLGLDLWEHAYYLKYKNRKEEYIKNFWKVVNWEFVNKLYKMKQETKLNEEKVFEKILNEQEDYKFFKSPNISLMQKIFANYPNIKNKYKKTINKILKDVFHEYWRESDGQSAAGIYDFDSEGRSTLNKLNTNFSALATIYDEVNNVLEKVNRTKIDFNKETEKEVDEEMDKLIKILVDNREKIFNTDSEIFKKVSKIVGFTHERGQKTEDEVIKKLKNFFGSDNVVPVGELGSSKDMIEGIDVEIIYDGKTKTAQIKPMTKIEETEEKFVIETSSLSKRYKTNWIIFKSYNKIYIFDNTRTQLDSIKYLIPKSDLLFSIK